MSMIGHNGGPILYEPRWYQAAAVQSLFDYFNNGGDGNPVVAMPTGTGKSPVIGFFIRDVMARWPGQRFLVATHVKKLIEQNAKTLNRIWPHAPFGIHSAGLNARDHMQPIIFGGVGSMYKTPGIFGHRDILIIDECHLLNPSDATMYMALINGLRETNPNLKVIGLSATIYRTGQGYIVGGDGIFTDVCYDLTDIDSFARLIAEGWLSPLIPKRTNIEIDTSQLHISSTGDYVQTELEDAAERITYAALQEAMQYANHRHSWLVFCSGVKHAVRTAEMLQRFGISATCVHSNTKDFKMSDKQADKNYEEFTEGKFRAITNNGKLTTGVDHPPIDLIVMLRATLSTSLWVQMLGRGTRPFEGNFLFPKKENCLVLDFAGNTRRLGPINDPVIPKRRGQGGGGDAPVKICEACGTYNHTSARECIGCGEEFIFQPKIVQQAGTDELIRNELPQIETFKVVRAHYYKHQGRNKPTPSLKVVYTCEGMIVPVTEWVNIEHPGFAGKVARDWWRTRVASDPPETVDEALQQVQHLRVPNEIDVWTNKQYPEVMRARYYQ